MHLTFVNSEGLEGVALSILSNSNPPRQRGKMTLNAEDSLREEGYISDEYLVIDENSPLLLTDLDPPGTTRKEQAGSRRGKRREYNTIWSFKIRRSPNPVYVKGIPLVVILTGLGMAAMVILGFVTMFEDRGSAVGPVPGPTENSVIFSALANSTTSSGNETGSYDDAASSGPSSSSALNSQDTDIQILPST